MVVAAQAALYVVDDEGVADHDEVAAVVVAEDHAMDALVAVDNNVDAAAVVDMA